MDRWFDHEETEKAYKARLDYMEMISDVTRWPSTAKAMVYLTIYGQLDTNELKDLLGLKGEKSIFRTLRPLIQAGFVKKTNSGKFQITGLTIHDPVFSEGFIRYLVSKNKLQILADYLANANKASNAFIEVTTELLHSKIMEQGHRTASFLKNARFLEMIFSGENMDKIKELTENYIAELKKLTIRPVPGNPVSMPASIYLTLMPLG